MSESDWITETWKDPQGRATGTRLSLKVHETLWREHTGCQELWIGLTEDFGRVMFLDGCLMLTERDEFIYHEMLSHMPLCSHPNPRRVLIVGGGDGGTLREVLRHPSVERAVLCEIDGKVIDASKRFLPTVHAGAFDDERTALHVGDGVSYLKACSEGSFDVIIIDSTDPIGPGEALFSDTVYADCARALTSQGVIALQSESPFKDPELFSMIQQRVRKRFGNSYPCLIPVPSYPSGLWSITLATRDHREPLGHASRATRLEAGCRYYSADVHRVALELPLFVKRLLPD